MNVKIHVRVLTETVFQHLWNILDHHRSFIGIRTLSLSGELSHGSEHTDVDREFYHSNHGYILESIHKFPQTHKRLLHIFLLLYLFPSGQVELNTVLVVFALPQTLVKNLRVKSITGGESDLVPLVFHFFL